MTCLGFKTGSFGTDLGNRHGNPFRSDLRNVTRNRFARFQGTFQETANRITGHLTSFFESLAEGADLRDSWHEDAVAALGEGLKDRRVAVFGQACYSIRPGSQRTL